MGQAPARSSSLAARLEREIEGEVHFDAFTRGRYSTDASHYQIAPLGVVVPRNAADVRCAIEIAGEAGAPVLPRGAGTSQCGQAVGAGLVIDTTRHLDGIVSFSPKERRITVEPGVVLDCLNAFLRPHGLHFPVDVSTSSRATIGGMAGNNSCGARSIRYGTMRANVRSIDAILANGASARFGLVTPESAHRRHFDRRAGPGSHRARARERGGDCQSASPSSSAGSAATTSTRSPPTSRST